MFRGLSDRLVGRRRNADRFESNTPEDECKESDPMLGGDPYEDHLRRELDRAIVSQVQLFCFIRCLSDADKLQFCNAFVTFINRNFKQSEHCELIALGTIPLVVWKQILESLHLVYNYFVWEALPLTYVNQRLLFKVPAAHRHEEARSIHIVLRNGHLRVVNFFFTIFPCDSDSAIPWKDQVGRLQAEDPNTCLAAMHLYRPIVNSTQSTYMGVQTGVVSYDQMLSVQAAAPVHTPAPTAAPSSSTAPVEATNQAPVNAHYKDIPNSNMRKVIAKRLTESKATVPHFYTSIECEIDALMALRKTFKKDMELNISVNDLVIKSAALALRDVPEANSRWNKQSGAIDASTSKQVDISVAVATPNGLITPILTGADKRGLVDINSTVKDLATRAREGKLKPEEYQGGSFSISNLGMFGITSFSAVINPPQACILAVGAGIQKVLPPKPNATVNRPRVVTTVTVQLSADRRVVDEATAAQYLQVFQSYLSNPHTITR